MVGLEIVSLLQLQAEGMKGEGGQGRREDSREYPNYGDIVAVGYGLSYGTNTVGLTPTASPITIH